MDKAPHNDLLFPGKTKHTFSGDLTGQMGIKPGTMTGPMERRGADITRRKRAQRDVRQLKLWVSRSKPALSEEDMLDLLKSMINAGVTEEQKEGRGNKNNFQTAVTTPLRA